MSTIAAHTYTVPTSEFFGGYRDEGGFYRTEPGTPTATYSGWSTYPSVIVDWGKRVADEKFGEGGWTINGHRIEPVNTDASRPMETLEFYQGSQIVDLSEYAYLLEDEDEDFDEDEVGDETPDAEGGGGFAPIGQVIQEAAEALVDDIVADIPRTEADLRERFRRHGLLV